MANLEKQMVFPTLIWRDHEVLDKNNLSQIKDYCYSINGRNSNSKLHKLKLFENLNKNIIKLSKQFMDDLNWEYEKLEITGMWSNKMTNKEFHRPHTHPNNLLSGVFYPENNDSKIIFLDPRNQSSIFLPYINKYTYLNSSIWSFPAVKNTLILFPSWLMHYVEMVQGTDFDRISISFNVMLKGNFGKAEDFTKSTI